MMPKSARVLAFLLALAPSTVLALGLGNVEVSTALNQPLRAEIPLAGVRPGEADAITVRLGTDEQFRRAGLERPFHLAQLRFEVVPEGARRARIEVTTREPVTEPFLNFLIEVSWPSGRMIREYTLLLDPPVYGAAINAARERDVAKVEAMPDSAGAPPAAPAPEPETAPAPPPVAVTAPRVEPPSAPAMPVSPPAPASAAAPAPEPAPAPAPAPDLAGTDRYGPVVANESLWSIATRVRPDEKISIQRMMLVLLEANPEAFNIHNINALRKGAVLRVPGLEEIGADEKATAMAEVRRQRVLWEDYRAQIAGAPAKAPEGTGVAAAAAGAAEPAAGEEAGRLELLAAGEAQSAGAPGGQVAVAELKNELNRALEDADSRQRENQELSERLQETEKIIGDLSRLLELKDDEIAQLQEQLRQQDSAPAPAPVPEAAAEAAPEPEPAPEIAAPAPAPDPATELKPQVTPPPGPEPVSFVGELLNTARGYVPTGVDPVLLAGGLGVVLVLSGGLALYRRRQAAEVEGEPAAIDFEEEAGPAEDEFAIGTEDEEAPDAADAGEAEEAAATARASLADADAETRPSEDTSSTLESENEDPLSELNIYMAYEHFDQAEDLVRRAIADHPDRHDYRLKLLEVFYAAKDLPSFQEAARELRDTVGEDSPLLATAAGWWNDLSPGRDLFAGPQGVSTAVENSDDEVFDVTAGGSSDDTAESAVDFDLSFEAAEAGSSEDDSQDSSVDFELESEEQAAAGKAKASGSDDVEFDLSGIDDEVDSAASDDFEFDLTERDDETAVKSDADDLAFDMDTEDSDSGVSKYAAPADDGLDFELDSDDSAEAGGAKDLDFDVGDDADTHTGDRDEGTAKDDFDAGLDFDLGQADVSEEEAASGDEDFAIGIDSGESDDAESFGLSLVGDDEEAPEKPSGGSSDLDFELGGEDESGDVGIDTGFKGVFDDESESSDDDPLGIGGGSSELPDLETGTEDAVDLTVVDRETTGADEDSLSDLDFGEDETPETGGEDDVTQYMLRDAPMPDEGADAGDGSADMDDIQTKLDLAEAYIEMGDTEGAKGILDEVMNQGSDAQQEQARSLVAKLA